MLNKFNRNDARISTQAILANTSAFHERMKKISYDDFWNEIDRSIQLFKGVTK